MALLRLDKIVSSSTKLSRREVKLLVKNGGISVNGKPAKSAEDKYDPQLDVITVKGELISYSAKNYFMMNKPADYLSSTEDARDKTVLELLKEGEAHLELFPAGRLDKDSEGLLLLTDDGEFCHNIISPNKKIYKRYFVRLEKEITDADVEAFKAGIELSDFKCMPAELVKGDEENSAYVTICEGKYHQVKRMFLARKNSVKYLKRMAIGGLKLDKTLSPGEYRRLTEEEIKSVFS